MPPLVKKTARKHPWNASYASMYGIKPIKEDNFTTSGGCNFCTTFGREQSMDAFTESSTDTKKAKRSKKKSNHVYKSFNTSNIKKHLESEHPANWTKYKLMNQEQKNNFFQQTSMDKFIVSNVKQDGDIRIEKKVVEVILYDVLCRGEKNQTDSICFSIDGESEEGNYLMKMINPQQFVQVIKSMARGLSFRQIVGVYQDMRDDHECAKYGNVTQQVVGEIARKVIAINLMAIMQLLEDCWAFALAMDGSTHRETGYLVIRLSIGVLVSTMNLHLLCIPFDHSHSGINMANMIKKVLVCLCPDYMEKLIGITSDGASNQMGCNVGANTLLKKEAEKSGKVFVVWCAAHQFDLVVQKTAKGINSFDGWYDTMSAFVGWQRRQVLLYQQVGKAKKACMTRWIYGYKCTKWMIVKDPHACDFFETDPELIEEFRRTGKKAVLQLLNGVHAIVLEVNHNGASSIPPTTPLDYIKCSSHEFNESIKQFEVRFTKAYGPTGFRALSDERNELCHRYRNEVTFKKELDRCNSYETFSDKWNSAANSFPFLLQFASGLNAIMGGSHSVESDFSLLKFTKNEQKSQMTNIALDGQMQSKQFKLL